MTPEQMEIRRTGIGGSQSASIAGLPAFQAPIDIYREKADGWTQEETFRLVMGELLEPVVLELLRRGLNDHQVFPWTQLAGTLKHPSLPLVATPDGFAVLSYMRNGKMALVEAKTCSKWALADWGEDGSDQVPKQYFAQVQHVMFVMRACGYDVEEALIPLLIDVTEFRTYRVAYAPDIAQALADKACAWWARHVETKTPPPPDGTPSYTDYLQAAYPLPQRGMEIEAPEDFRRLADLCLHHKRMAEEEETNRRRAQQHIVQLMGEAESIAGFGYRATYRASKNGGRTFKLTEVKP